MGHPLKYRKMSKSDATEPSNIVITDEIRLKALQSELNYWKISIFYLRNMEATSQQPLS